MPTLLDDPDTEAIVMSADVIDRRKIENETLRLASISYSVENQARVETLLWVLGYIDSDKCPTGSADDDRIREITNRGSWPFDPSLDRADEGGSA